MAPLSVLRRQRLLSQATLAKQAGVAESTVHLIEAGKNTRPRLEVMRKLCAALGVQPTEVDEFRRAIEAEPGQPGLAA